MKKLFAFLLVISTICSCSASKIKESQPSENKDLALFNKGVTIFELLDELYLDSQIKRLDTLSPRDKIKYEVLSNGKEEILELAMEQFETLIYDHPKSEFYHKSLYNLALLSHLLDYDEDEIDYLQQLLNSNANDREHSGRKGIMQNPYANFKHEASQRLTEIYIQKQEFETALKYMDMSKTYPLQHFCGNAFAAEDIYQAEQYAKIYIGLDQTKKALDHLLPHIFNNGLADNTGLVDLSLEFLKNHFPQKQLISNFETSITEAYSKVEQIRGDDWTNYYIKFLDTEIEIPSWSFGFEANEDNIQTELEKTIRESEFYKKLIEE